MTLLGFLFLTNRVTEDNSTEQQELLQSYSFKIDSWWETFITKMDLSQAFTSLGWQLEMEDMNRNERGIPRQSSRSLFQEWIAVLTSVTRYPVFVMKASGTQSMVTQISLSCDSSSSLSSVVQMANIMMSRKSVTTHVLYFVLFLSVLSSFLFRLWMKGKEFSTERQKQQSD